MSNPKKASNQGFTLVELSIVIIIIGFLIAGIAAGNSLIKQAAFSSIIREVGQFNIAVHTFKDRYGALPGDLTNARAYWPLLNSNTNGNGNGLIDTWAGGETINAWAHLSVAGLLQGSYADTGGVECTADYNCPGSKYPGGIYYWADIWPYVGGFGFGRNLLGLGGFYSFDFPWAAIFTPAEVQNIDIKMDDGKPGGKMYGFRGNDPNGYHGYPLGANCCTNNAWCNVVPDTYNITEPTRVCTMYFDFDITD